MLMLGQALYMHFIWKVDWLSHIDTTVETDLRWLEKLTSVDISWLWSEMQSIGPLLVCHIEPVFIEWLMYICADFFNPWLEFKNEKIREDI